ncbi:PREDICTED: uncharacterized protein LOC105570488, partial [Vollenhovia emeryi]|uniref:uncharacterized protein LOC105570488 n=1 Tax=Vollenhovia emeryi TaxID=411798 RepID=UPI0005F409E2
MTSMSTSMEDHFNRIYEVLTSLSQTVKELKTGLLAVEKKINMTRDPPALDVTNMERSFPLQTIDDVKAFEKNLTENVEEYNKFVSYCKQLRGRIKDIRIHETRGACGVVALVLCRENEGSRLAPFIFPSLTLYHMYEFSIYN